MDMEYFDEEILEAKRELEKQRHTTLETGIYAGDELITFAQVPLLDSQIRIFLPEQFIVMPNIVKDVKYPSKSAPDYIITSLDSTVNFGFNILRVQLKIGDTKEMSSQFQKALHNVNPTIRIKNRVNDLVTDHGNEMCWFDFKGYVMDGQNYNRMYIVRMRETVLHGIFNCPMQYKEQWEDIVEQCFLSIEEDA